MTFELLDYHVTDRIAEITMRKPPGNAVNLALIEEINSAYRLAKDDEGVRAVILTSAFDETFSAGPDLAMIESGDGLQLRRFLEKLYFEMHDLQYRMGKPTIAAVTGAARAAGVTLAVSCDVIVASDKATIGYPEIDVGLIPAMHLVHLPRQIGRHKAFEFLFGAEPIPAIEAERIGLINRVVPLRDMMGEARRIAAVFADKSPAIMKITRDAFMRLNDADYRRSIESTVDTICHVMETPDGREGLRAYVEKRQPKWRND